MHDDHSTGKGKGFASMEETRRKEVAARGGSTAHSNGTAHMWTPEEAAAAGKRSGAVRRKASPTGKHTLKEQEELPMGKRRVERDFQIVESHVFTRRKSIIGYLYILLDADEPSERAMVYTDHLKHSNHHACTCTERNPRYICAHIKFIERTRRNIPVLPNPMATQYITSTAVPIDETRMIESTLVAVQE